MPEESLREKMRRNRRKQNLGWTEEDELKWLQDHPEDRPEGWVDPTAVTVVHDDDLVPDIEIDETYVDTLAPYLDPITVIDAYVRWSGKQLPADCNPDREEVQVSCPIPGHVDADPSCSINTKLGVWNCYTCQQGGDKYDIYALNRGWGTDYKPEFYNLRKAMATELGWSEPEEFDTPDSSESDSEPATAPPSKADPASTITRLTLVESDASERTALEDFRIDWESIIPPETFMWEWMQSTAVPDDLPHEYYFWIGMQAIGFASGANIWMPDQHPVKPNINVCNYGKTGSGKSRAIGPYEALLERALPWTGTDYEPSTGTLIVPSPASPEALLHSFSHDILEDPTNKHLYYAPIRGLVKFEELSALIQKASTSSMKEKLIELYDKFRGPMKHKSRTSGTITAESPFCQLLTTTQPSAIHAFLNRTHVESGFLNRWIYALGPRRKRRMSYGGAAIDIDDAVMLLKRLHEWCDTERQMPLRGDAYKVWDHLFEDQVYVLVEDGDSICSRIDLFLKKLMLIMAINEREDAITPSIVERTCVLVPYLRDSLCALSRDIAFTETQACINKIVALYDDLQKKKKGKPPTTKDYRMRLHKMYPDEVIQRAMKTAQDLGLIPDAKNNRNAKRPVERPKPPT